MVNSGSFDSDGQGDRNAKAGLTQPHSAPDSTQSSSPVTASAATSCNSGFSQTADSGLPSVAHAIEPTPTKTEFNCDMPVENFTNLSSVDGEVEESTRSPTVDEKTSLCCSLPLEKIQGVLTSYHSPLAKPDDDGAKATKQPTRKLLCLYCERSFVSANLRQKHVERIHSVKQNRRVSSRRQNQLTVTPCVYCDKLNGTENTLKDLFQHLINEHSSKYFGCLPCEDRFLTSSLLADHNAASHQSDGSQTSKLDSSSTEKTTVKLPVTENVKVDSGEEVEEIPVKITRSKMKPKPEEEDKTKKSVAGNKKKSTKLKELRSKKLSVKSSRIALKRRESKRLQAIAKLTDTQKKKRPRPIEKKNSNPSKTEQTNSTKSTEKIKTNPTCINPYPEFDNFYRVKKITDHSIDNLKISSLTFDDVFDKAFFNRIRCNIEENLLHHIDGKLFKNEESESRISNFEKVSNVPQEIHNSNSENFGCELSLNAVTPVASLSLNSQFGEDFESQIEYGSKPSKKKTQPRKDEIHYKYFTRRKYQASILEHKENRDLSKLDMWTQLVIKKRQQKMLDDKKSAKEILEYTSCDEYKNKLQREELNRILDRRGPFEDLKEEASKKAALDKLNSASEDNISEETFTEVREVLNEILNRVFAVTDEVSLTAAAELEKTFVSNNRKEDLREIPGYLNLRRSSSLPSDGEIDKSDRIALICSSQETENFELPTNQVRGKNELIELTGEWARCRMYICAACGAKLPNMRYLLDHKSLYHQNVWVQHYEFVGNQSELYRHLSIPTLGKVGAVEESVQCKVWRRSDARLCTKCGKQCNSLGELHRHILECGGDWTWMLARKKCKYRPFGAKSRRKRRGLINRTHNKQKTEPTEKKTYKKTFEGPRQRPSDADTIQRMLANLPAKRSTRKLISLHDGIYRARKTTQNIKQNKVKCGKVIYKSSTHKETTEKTINTVPNISKSQINSSSSRRSLRNLNKVLASRILDTNLNVKRKIKALNERRRTRQSQVEQEISKEIINDENFEQIPPSDSGSATKPKTKVTKKDDIESEGTHILGTRSSPRSSPKNLKKKMSVKKILTGKINIKSFFPVKKKKTRKIFTENQNPQDVENTEVENSDIKTRSKRKIKTPCDAEEEKKDEIVPIKTEQKKSKHETFSTLVRSLSLRKKKLAKKAIQNRATEKALSNTNIKQQCSVLEKSEENKQTGMPNGQELNKTVKKRKLKSSFRNVINKVKKLKIDNPTENATKVEELKLNSKNQKESAFLEEDNLEEPSVPIQIEKIAIPSISEAKENTADISMTASTVINFHDNNENPPIPETIFKLELNNEKSLQAKGELNFDTQPINTNVNKSSDSNVDKNIKTETPCKESNTALEKDKTVPISIETSVKPKIVPLISPNMKGKIRKPTRGLNDCIAMLTSKLQQKPVQENSHKVDSIFSLLLPNKAPPPNRENCPPKNECILRIPTYRSQLIYPEVEETALDLSTKSLRNKEVADKEPFEKSLDIYNKTVIVKFNDTQINNKNFVVPTFDRKITKTCNSVDRIIEEVVENRIQSIIPQIQHKKWNSVDDIIQKVINDQRSQLRLPVRNSVDDIIDFVIDCGRKLDNKINEKKANINENFKLNKEITIRKIGSVRKPKSKKLPVEVESPEVIINDIATKIVTSIAKESLENTSVMKLDDNNGNENLSNIIPAKNEFLKKKNKSKQFKNIQIASRETVVETPAMSTVIKIAESIPKDENSTEEEISSSSKENSIQNVETITNPIDSSQKDDLHLNDAFIDKQIVEKSFVKVKKGTRKVGQIRNKSWVKKDVETKIVEPRKIMETNIDSLLDTKEIKSIPVLEYSTNVSINTVNGDSLLTKNDEINQLSNEDEPHLLENKPMVLEPKPSTLPSDSEDDIPLAVLVKSDERVANPNESISKNKNLEEMLSCAEKAVEKYNINIFEVKAVENNPIDKSKIDLTNDPDISKQGEKLFTSQDQHCDKVLQIQTEEDTNTKKDNMVYIDVVDRTINKEKCISNLDIAKNTGNGNSETRTQKTETKVNKDLTNVDKKQTQVNDILDVKMSTNTEIVKQKLDKHITDITHDTDKQNNISDDKELSKCRENSLKSSSENGYLSEIVNKPSKTSFNKREEIPLDSESLEIKNNRRSKPSKQQTNSFNVSDKLVSASSECEENTLYLPKSLSEIDKQSQIDPRKELIREIEGNSSKLICFLEKTSKGVERITEESKRELKSMVKKSINKIKTKSDLSTESLLNDVSSEAKTEELTVQLKPLSTSKILNFKGKSESLVDTSEENIQEHMLELKPIVVESKSKILKSKGKTKPLKTKVHENSKFSNDMFNRTECFEEQKLGTPVLPESLEKISNKKLQSKWNQNLLMEDEIPLKKLYQNVCEVIAKSDKPSYESEETDKEIENILFSSPPEVKPRSKANLKSKNIKNHLETNIVDKSDSNYPIFNKSIEHIEKSREKSSPKKSRRSLKIKEIKNNSDFKSTEITDTNNESIKALFKDNNSKSLETTKSHNEVLPIISEVDVSSNETPKEFKQPLMKSLEIALEITDVKKSILSLSSNKNVISNEMMDKATEFETDIIGPEIAIKKQSKYINKESVTMSSDDSMVKNCSEPNSDSTNYIDENQIECILNRSKIEGDKSNKIKSKSLKNKPALNITAPQDHLITIDITNSPAREVSEEPVKNKISISRSSSKEDIYIEETEKNTDSSSIFDESISLNTTQVIQDIDHEIQLEESHDVNSQFTVKRKVKHKRSTKTSKKAKNKAKRTSEINKHSFELKQLENDIFASIEKAPILNAVENTNMSSADKETNKTIDLTTKSQMKENADKISNKISEEPPIKIIINKQKTRRKSKSFKKNDLKGQNDLYEDFALVIKKPKRITSIIAFTRADTFSKDIYPNYLKKSSEERLQFSKALSENEEEDDTPTELDSSVEEMDMELDEIPITSNIIERDKSYLPPVTDEFIKPDIETLVETINELENNKQKDKEESGKIEDNMKSVPIEELLLPSDKDLTLPTEAEVEEFLYETNRKFERNKTIDKQDNKNNTLDGSYQIEEDLTKINLISENVKHKTENNINQGLIIPTQGKLSDSIIEGTTSNCDSHSNEDEGKISTAKALSKKKQSKTNRNTNKTKAILITTEPEDINVESSFVLLEASPVLNKINDNKRKRSKSIAVDEISSAARPEGVVINRETNKLKDMDSIYAFSESEDFEIEKPIEKPKRPSRKQTKSLSESVDATNDDFITDKGLPFPVNDVYLNQSQNDLKHVTDHKEVITSGLLKRRPRSCNLSSDHKIIGEIKENDVNTQEEGRRSVRSAKVKALEHIHDDALAELTESERNRGLEKDKRNSINECLNSVEELNKKRISRRQSKSQKISFDELKLSSESPLATNDNHNLDHLNENENEADNKSTNESVVPEPMSSVEKELTINEIPVQQEVQDSLIQSTKKTVNKKIKAIKTHKTKKSINIFQITAEDSEKSLLLKDIAGELPDLEELENSIEKELNVDIELRKASKQSKSKSKQTEIKLSETVPEGNENTGLPIEDNNQELRRSRRGSRKITSYNENDLIDPLLDEIDGKKKIRKKEKAMLEELENKNIKKLKEPEKKLNSDELFDLLKASSTENSCVQKAKNTFLDNTDFNEHNFQNALENILDHPSSIFKQNNCTEKSKEKSVENIYEFTDSPETNKQPKDNVLSLENNTRKNKKVSKPQAEENSDSVLITAPVSENKTLIPSTPDMLELSTESRTKSHKSDKPELTNKSNYCEICNKKFIRTDNLVKHKRTLTHIQKLSEIEAKEAAQRSQSHEPSNNFSKTSNSIIEMTSESAKITEDLSKVDININDILQESDKPNRQQSATDHTSFPNNHSLKLADIINDVLNKPVLESDNDKHNSFSDIIMQNNADVQPEYRRYKSLGERKSFDSEPIEPRPIHISEPYVSKTTILEKQISLLENIIENQTGVNYIDDISMSSNNSLENNTLVSPSELSLKQDDSNTYSRINLTKPITNDESFLKPSQYEEISEDSVNVRSYEDQKLRKTLNRDEELFLECCSLLKSGSEMSSYSNKKCQNKVLNTMGLKQCDEPEWLERKSLVEKPLYDVGNEYSDNSRIPTPLGDSYDDDASNSNTISSNWNMNNKVNDFEDISQDKEDNANKSFSFQEILNEDEEKDKNKSSISKFGGILSKTIGALPKMIKRSTASDNYVEEFPAKKNEELSDGSTSEGKKIITKGARKVFEGLKVSIPTEELNLEEVLNCSPKSKKIDIVNIQNSSEGIKTTERQLSSTKPTRTSRKSKPVKNKSQFGSNLLFKMKKKKIASPVSTKNKNDEVKSHDIYDFEETQDNTDVFTKPDFRAFRNMKSNEPVPEPESDTDSRDYMDSFSYEAQSIASSISSSSSKKPKTQENITKKKCMIMGRIFKNAAKSKIEDIDEEIRDIPALDNCELVENYVADCKKIIKNEEVTKPKLSEKEINQLFDQLLEDRLSSNEQKNIETKPCAKSKTEALKKTDKKKAKPKNKKRARTNSDSTDDEFSLNKTSKKRAYRKNAKAEDNCINLEQELKECIGVASRKSQRKCTSGKQNVLVEYWSSDDSQFEALLESQRIEVKQSSKVVEANRNAEPEPVSQVSEIIIEDSSVLLDKSVGFDTADKQKPKSVEKKPQQKQKPSSEKKPKSITSGTEKTSDSMISNRRKRAAVNPLYHWSSSSEDESQDLIEVKPLRDELEDDEDRPVQHGWIVGDSPKKLVTMLAQAKGKKTDIDCVKEQGKKRTNAVS